MRGHLRVPLYDPAEAERMRPLPAGTVELMQRRRTCFGCGKTRRTPFPRQDRELGGECRPCHDRRRAEERAAKERMCLGCGLVADEPWEWNRCEPCREQRRAELAEQERRETVERRELDTETTDWLCVHYPGLPMTIWNSTFAISTVVRCARLRGTGTDDGAHDRLPRSPERLNRRSVRRVGLRGADKSTGAKKCAKGDLAQQRRAEGGGAPWTPGPAPLTCAFAQVSG
jgi:hypothetical protein